MYLCNSDGSSCSQCDDKILYIKHTYRLYALIWFALPLNYKAPHCSKMHWTSQAVFEMVLFAYYVKTITPNSVMTKKGTGKGHSLVAHSQSSTKYKPHAHALHNVLNVA